MANEHQDDNRFLRILKKQLETLKEESNHLHEVLDGYVKNVENELQEWENKYGIFQVSFEEMSVSIQQAIAHVMSQTLHFTDWKVSDSVTMKISLLEESLKRTIQNIQIKQENADVRLNDFSVQHDTLNQKLDMVEENNLNTKSNLQNNIKEQSDKITDFSKSIQQLEANGNARFDRLEKEIKTMCGSTDVMSTHISSVRSCVNDAVKSIEGLSNRTDILEQEYLDVFEEMKKMSDAVNISSAQSTVDLTGNSKMGKISQIDILEQDGSDVSQEDETYDSQEDDEKYDSCNKKDTYETQVSEGGEADLHKYFDDCKKNPGHTQFVPINDFRITHLPYGYRDNNLVEYIKAVANLTVRVDVKMPCTERPEFWPNPNQPYALYDKRGSDVIRLGTGVVTHVNKWAEEDIKKNNKGTCQCHKCQHSDTPSNVWGEVRISTVRQVVFDDLEGRQTTCRFFYDSQDSPMVTLNCLSLNYENVEEDRCVLKCVTCDVDFLDKLENIYIPWEDLCRKVNNTYRSFRDKDKLTFIISHPHGTPKQISLGRWIKRDKVSSYKSIYTYTTCTCPGSSGAHVHSLGYVWYNDSHFHMGVNSMGINFSDMGRDLF